nr:hypothetical protein [Tanacetum cinerariifolium]
MINSRHEQPLNDFMHSHNIIEIDNLESDNELVDTPLVSPFLDSDYESDDVEVLNELDEYENLGNFYRNRIINSLDGKDLALPCMIGFRKFVAYFDPFLPMSIIMHKAYNTIMVEGLKSMRRNLVAIVRDVYVFVGSFTYVTNFVVLEDIGEFIESLTRANSSDPMVSKSSKSVNPTFHNNMPSLDDVLEKKPWMIRNSPIILKNWFMDTRLCKDDLTRNLIMLDSYITLMCIESWERSSFSCCMIEINAKDVLQESLTMGVPLIEGMGFTIKTVTIEYEWKPLWCDLCNIFGHVQDHFPKKVLITPYVVTFNVATLTVEKTNDEFQTVDYESDDVEVLNELDEYENLGNFYRNRIINSLDGKDLALPCMIGFRKFVAYFDPFLPMSIIMHKAYNTIMVEGLKSMRRNLVAIVRDVYVFVGSFTYVTNFVVLEDIGEFIVSYTTKIVMGRPFRAVTQLEYDCVKGLISFNRIFDTYIFWIPRMIPRLKNFEWSKVPPILELIQQDLMSGLMYSHVKNKLMYKNCLNQDPEYLVDEDMKEWLICGHVSIDRVT